MKARKLLSILLALLMVATLSIGALAADEEPTGTEGSGETATVPTAALANAKLTKELTVADGIDISAVNTFTFSFTAGETETAATADHPEIAAQSVIVGTQSDGKATGELTMDSVFTISEFPHAGEYVYTVKETTTNSETTNDGITKTLTCNTEAEEYTVHVYVVNGESGLEFKYITVANKAGEKVDPSSEFVFKNEYKEVIVSESGVLTVNKTITGDYADKTKEFPITVEITIPELAATTDVVAASGTVSWNDKVGTITANLADGGKIQFTTLPAGTTFVVKETQDSFYQSKTTGYVASVDTEYQRGNVEKAGEGPITTAGKEVNIENNREDAIPTGVIIETLPYVFLVAVAIGGIVFFVIKKRKEA